MEINKLIKNLEYVRDNYNVKEVRIPRLGYIGSFPIEESEFSKKFVQDGVLYIEGMYIHT